MLWKRRRGDRNAAPRDVMFRRVASGIGAVALGLTALAFAKLGDLAQHIFLKLVASSPLLSLILTPMLFGIVMYATKRWTPEGRGSGIPQVIAASKTPDSAADTQLVSIKTAIFKFVLTLLMLLGGASVGREGPTVQISAAIMVWFHKRLRVPITSGVVIAGGAAGVAAAFNTPLAGIAFAIEELASAYEQRVAVMVMGTVMIAGLVSLGAAGDYVYFGQMPQTLPVTAVLLIAPVTGIAGGVLGGLFSRIVLAFAFPKQSLLRRTRSRPVIFATVCGLLVALLGVTTHGLTWGTGYETTKQLIEAHPESIWFGPTKFVAALATTLSGTPGGIFAPSLSVGAGIGNMLKLIFPNDPAGAVVLLGMAAYFVGVVRAPLTAVIILTETTASRGMILPLFATALIADAVSALVCRQRLYHGLASAFSPQPPLGG